jgi:hypothetical protein
MLINDLYFVTQAEDYDFQSSHSPLVLGVSDIAASSCLMAYVCSYTQLGLSHIIHCNDVHTKAYYV